MKKLSILIVSVMMLAATGCCGLHGGGCNSCGYGGGGAPAFGGGCPGGNCGSGLGPVGYNTPAGTTTASAIPTAAPTLATAPTPYARTAMVTPMETLPTY